MSISTCEVVGDLPNTYSSSADPSPFPLPFVKATSEHDFRQRTVLHPTSNSRYQYQGAYEVKNHRTSRFHLFSKKKQNERKKILKVEMTPKKYKIQLDPYCTDKRINNIRSIHNWENNLNKPLF